MSAADFYAGRRVISAVENERKRIKAKWGNLGRVRLMAPPALRERYDRQEARWEAAVQAGELAGLQAEQPRMLRALQAIEREAREVRAATDVPPWFEVRLSNGRVLAIARTREEAKLVPHRFVTMTLEDICYWLRQRLDSATPVAEALAGARVVETEAVNWERPFRADEPSDIVG